MYVTYSEQIGESLVYTLSHSSTTPTLSLSSLPFLIEADLLSNDSESNYSEPENTEFDDIQAHY